MDQNMEGWTFWYIENRELKGLYPTLVAQNGQE
jgi:hypothetical protein